MVIRKISINTLDVVVIQCICVSCQYCDGRNTSTLDWNAPLHSAHTAMVNYDKPGQGLGLTFT